MARAASLTLASTHPAALAVHSGIVADTPRAEVSKELGITQKATWFMLASKKLNAGRGTVSKQAVMGLKQRGGTVKAMPIADTSAKTLVHNVAKNVEPGATVSTDEHAGYNNLGERYEHGTVKHSVREYVNGMAHTNGIESVWAVLKRGYNGTYHQWSAKHMARYVNEFTFRLNEGNVKRPTLERLESLVKGTIGKRLTYADLTQ